MKVVYDSLETFGGFNHAPKCLFAAASAWELKRTTGTSGCHYVHQLASSLSSNCDDAAGSPSKLVTKLLIDYYGANGWLVVSAAGR